MRACPFCDQEEETINHVLLTCVFARTVWASIFVALGTPSWIPTAQETLVEWAVDKRGSNNVNTKDLRTIFALTWWELWKHRNAIIFEDARPCLEYLLGRVRQEGQLWASAGLMKGNVTPFFSRVERWETSEE